MGQYRSYKSSFLENEVAEIERELVAYKATQGYGAVQIQSRIATASTTSVTVPGNNITTFVFGRVSFVGVNKNKLARGSLTWGSSNQTYSWYLCEASDDRAANEMKWYVYLTARGTFDITFNAYMNMDGKLNYESLI